MRQGAFYAVTVASAGRKGVEVSPRWGKGATVVGVYQRQAEGVGLVLQMVCRYSEAGVLSTSVFDADGVLVYRVCGPRLEEG